MGVAQLNGPADRFYPPPQLNPPLRSSISVSKVDTTRAELPLPPPPLPPPPGPPPRAGARASSSSMKMTCNMGGQDARRSGASIQPAWVPACKSINGNQFLQHWKACLPAFVERRTHTHRGLQRGGGSKDAPQSRLRLPKVLGHHVGPVDDEEPGASSGSGGARKHSLACACTGRERGREGGAARKKSATTRAHRGLRGGHAGKKHKRRPKQLRGCHMGCHKHTPGGPYRSTPRGGATAYDSKSCGACRGSATISRSAWACSRDDQLEEGGARREERGNHQHGTTVLCWPAPAPAPLPGLGSTTCTATAAGATPSCASRRDSADPASLTGIPCCAPQSHPACLLGGAA